LLLSSTQTHQTTSKILPAEKLSYKNIIRRWPSNAFETAKGETKKMLLIRRPYRFHPFHPTARQKKKKSNKGKQTRAVSTPVGASSWYHAIATTQVG
jgi:hypothetical protein